MAKGVVVMLWDGGTWGGHLGLSVEADAGTTYVTWVPSEQSGDPGTVQSIQDDLRTYTGIRAPGRMRDLFRTATDEQIDDRGQHRITTHGTRATIGTQTFGLNPGQIIQPPDRWVEIPAIDVAGGRTLGLDVERIYHWWEGFRTRAEDLNAGYYERGRVPVPWTKYSATRNCCSVVYLALVMGGASYYRKKWFKRFILTPREVLHYAENLERDIKALNDSTSPVVHSVAGLTAKLKTFTTAGPDTELPTSDVFKRESNVKGGLRTGLARRSTEASTIDDALDRYHLQPWPNDSDISWAAADARDNKAKELRTIIETAAKHLATKPRSDRRHAMAALLTTALQVMRRQVLRIRHYYRGVDKHFAMHFLENPESLTQDRWVY